MRIFSLVVIVCGWIAPLSAMQKGHSEGDVELIGVKTIQYEDTARRRPMLIELWYPTDAVNATQEPNDSIWIHPQEARNSPVAECCQEFPLIIMSHGHKGDRREGSWLAKRLVHSGYIVAAVEHYGNTRTQFNPLISLQFWERARDISAAIDHLLSESFLSGRINSERIGFVGYSLGGMTGLGLGGATVDSIEQLIAQTAGKHGDIKLEGISKESLEEAKKPIQDRRIRSMLLICPASFVYTSESLKKIRIPIGLIAAPKDEVLPYQEHAFRIIKYLMPAKLKVMKDEISHYAFLNPLSKKGMKHLGKYFHTKSHPYDRLSVHQEVGTFAVDFFKEFL